MAILKIVKEGAFIRADDSPTGRRIEEGQPFKAPSTWLSKRRHIIGTMAETVSFDEYRAYLEESEDLDEKEAEAKASAHDPPDRVYLKIDGEGEFVHAFESPTGERLEHGDVFMAKDRWLHERLHCPFLESISRDEYEAALADIEEDQEPEEDLALSEQIAELAWPKIQSLTATVKAEVDETPSGSGRDAFEAFLLEYDEATEAALANIEE